MPEEIIKIKDTVKPVASGMHTFVSEKGETQLKTVDGNFGITILDHFAGLAMQSLLGIADMSATKESVAFAAYDMAEFMMDEKARREAK